MILGNRDWNGTSLMYKYIYLASIKVSFLLPSLYHFPSTIETTILQNPALLLHLSWRPDFALVISVCNSNVGA